MEIGEKSLPVGLRGRLTPHRAILRLCQPTARLLSITRGTESVHTILSIQESDRFPINGVTIDFLQREGWLTPFIVLKESDCLTITEAFISSKGRMIAYALQEAERSYHQLELALIQQAEAESLD